MSVRPLCRWFWRFHRFGYVGENWEWETRYMKVGWNLECSRCGKRMWSASARAGPAG